MLTLTQRTLPDGTGFITHEAVGAGDDHELRFDHLFPAGPTFVFPCDVEGRVDLDALSALARNDYFFARVLIGREVTVPRVACRGWDAPRVGRN